MGGCFRRLHHGDALLPLELANRALARESKFEFETRRMHT